MATPVYRSFSTLRKAVKSHNGVQGGAPKTDLLLGHFVGQEYRKYINVKVFTGLYSSLTSVSKTAKMYSKHLNRSNSTYSSNKLNRKFSASGIFPFQLSIAKSAVVVLFFLNAIIIVCLIQALHYTKQENKKLQMKLKQLTAAQSLLEKEQEKPTAQTKIKKDQQYEYSQVCAIFNYN